MESAAARADRVRIMPFLEGIPCSIHGIVFETQVIAVRPVEMLTLRRPDVGILEYVGTATFYDPPDDIRRAMRSVAVGTVVLSGARASGAVWS